MTNKPVGIDLFAGAGGLSLGFEAAGFDMFFANEIDRYAAATYSANRSGSVVVDTRDIGKVAPSDVMALKSLTKGELDIVIGGPPCQGFSTSNTKTRNTRNPVNELVFSYVNFVGELWPKWCVMENVAGLKTFCGGTVLSDLQSKLETLGYETEVVVLNAVDFGVPQNRKRTFLIGNRLGVDLHFVNTLLSKRLHPPLTVNDAISDLPELSNGNLVDMHRYKTQAKNEFQTMMRESSDEFVANNSTTKHSELSITRFENIRQGENLIALHKRRPDLVSNYKNMENCHHWIYLRLHPQKPSVVLNNFRKNMLIHPYENRGLSVREAARFQSFPDHYIFQGPLGFQQQQVANAVPPLLANAIAEAIIEAMRAAK